MFYFRSYKEVKSTYATCKEVQRVSDPLCKKFSEEMWKEFKTSARRFYHRPRLDPLAESIRGSWRTHMDADGEYGYDYTIIPDRGETDEEIKEFMYDSPVYLGRSNSPYDCTGKAFTRWWSFKRTPAGIALIHAWGIDV